MSKVSKGPFFVTLGPESKRVVGRFSTKKEAFEHARFAVKVGAMKACVFKRNPTTGTKIRVGCSWRQR